MKETTVILSTNVKMDLKQTITGIDWRNTYMNIMIIDGNLPLDWD